MAQFTDKANLEITLNNQQAKAKMEELQAEMKRLIDLRDQAQKAGDLKSYNQFDRQLKKATREAKNYEKALFDIKAVLRNVNGASLEDLYKAKQKLTQESKRLNRETAEYAKNQRQLKSVNREIQNITNSTKASAGSIRSFAVAMNDYFTMATAIFLAFAGLSRIVRGAIQSFADYDEAMIDAMKTTKSTRADMEAISATLKTFDTKTAQNELLNLAWVAGKLGIQAKKDIEGFVKAGDMIGVALGRDLGGSEDAIRALGKLVDIFKLSDEFGMEKALLKVGSAINELGMASTAAEGTIINFARRTAGIAPIAGIAITDILGLGAALDSLGQTAEVSSTAYSKLMSTMTKKPETFAKIARIDYQEFLDLIKSDANEAMLRLFEGLGNNSEGLTDLVAALGEIGLEGQRMTAVFGAMANNTDKIRISQQLSNQSYVEGTSVINEFNLKNTSTQAEIDKARKSFELVRVELGQKLRPAYISIIGRARTMLNIISALTDILTKHGRTLLVAGLTIASYTVAIKLAAFWKARFTEVSLKDIIVQKASAIAYKLQFAAVSLYNTAIALLTGRLRVAAVQFRAFTAAIAANPIGLIVAAVTAAAGALWAYTKRLQEATAASKALQDIEIAAHKYFAKEKTQAQELLKIAQDTTMDMGIREVALIKLKKLSKEHFGQLTLETIASKEAAKAEKLFTEEIIKNAKARAARHVLEELEAEKFQDDIRQTSMKVKWHQTLLNNIRANGNAEMFSALQTKSSLKNKTKFLEDYAARHETISKIIKENTNKYNPFAGLEPEDPKKPYSFENLDSSEQQDLVKQALEILDKVNKERILALKEQYAKEEIEAKEFQFRMLINESAYLHQKLELLKSLGADTLDVEAEIVDRQIALNKFREDELKNIMDEQTKENEDFLQYMLNQQAAMEKRYLDEKVDATKDSIDKILDLQKEQIKKEEKMYDNRAKTIADLATNLGSTFDTMLLDQEATLAQALRNVVMMTLDALEKILVATQAEIIMSALAKSAWNPAAAAEAFAKVILLKAAFATAKAAILANTKKEDTGYVDGGYTPPGPKDKPAGIVHAGEYVVPQSGVKNPNVKKILDIFEYARRNQTLAQLDIQPIVQTRSLPQLSSGGYSKPTVSQNPLAGQTTYPAGLQPEHIIRFEKAVDKLTAYEPSIGVDLIQKNLNILKKIKASTNL